MIGGQNDRGGAPNMIRGKFIMGVKLYGTWVIRLLNRYKMICQGGGGRGQNDRGQNDTEGQNV